MGLANYEKYEVLKLRSENIPYSRIGEMFNLTTKQVSDVCTKVRKAIYDNNFRYINSIADSVKVPNTDVVKLARYHIRVSKYKRPLLIHIKINDITNDKNIWYANKKGSVMEAKREQGYYIVNNNPLFKVKEKDCTELPTQF